MSEWQPIATMPKGREVELGTFPMPAGKIEPPTHWREITDEGRAHLASANFMDDAHQEQIHAELRDDANVDVAINMLRGKTVHELITNALDVHMSNMGMNVGDGDAETLADKVVSALELAGFVVSRSR